MKKIISLLMIAALLLAFSGCTKGGNSSDISTGGGEGKKFSANVLVVKGPSGIGMTPLMEKAAKGEAQLNYSFGAVAANDEIVAKIMSKEADIAAVATNLAAILYKKTNGGIKVLAVSTLGAMSIVAKGVEIESIEDLRGKTVYSIGQGANPEYILKYILSKNGLTAGVDVDVQFLSQSEELVTTVITGDTAIVFAPEPVATTITVKDSAAKIALDMNKEWNKVSDTGLVMGCVIVRSDYVNQNPKAVETFLKEYEESIKGANSDVDATAALCEKFEIIPAAAIAKKAIPNCNLVFQKGKEMKKEMSAYLTILFGYSPASVGGELPDDAFYYEKK